MKRPARIALEILAPPLFVLGCLYSLVALAFFGTTAYARGSSGEHLVILIGVCLVVGGPSVIYTAAIEFAFARGLLPGSWRAVGVSTCLGVIAGASIGGLAHVHLGSHDTGGGIVLLSIAAGTTLAFSVAAIVRFLSKKSQNQPVPAQRP